MGPFVVRSWAAVLTILNFYPSGTILRVTKQGLPHPKVFGMFWSVGMPEGQVADYRKVLPGGAGFHVKDFQTHYEVHIDRVHPDINVIEHLRHDAPSAFVASSTALGALVGTALGRSGGAALAGAAVGGLVGLLLLPDAAKTPVAPAAH